MHTGNLLGQIPSPLLRIPTHGDRSITFMPITQ